MRHIAAISMAIFATALSAGCASVSGTPVVLQNPMPVPPTNHDVVWDETVAVVDSLFSIEHEYRIRQVGDTLTVGELATFPELGATILEPWRGDSVTLYDRVECTLQTIRRHCKAQVVPTAEGYFIEVAVFKELENLPRPDFATTGSVNFRNDASIERLTDVVGPQVVELGWIPLGRDPELEQRILSEINYRLQNRARLMGCPLPHMPKLTLPKIFAPQPH